MTNEEFNILEFDCEGVLISRDTSDPSVRLIGQTEAVLTPLDMNQPMAAAWLSRKLAA